MPKPKFLARHHMQQFWKVKADGSVLLINLNPDGKYHYDGDGHIFFLHTDSIVNSLTAQSGATKITEAEFNAVRDAHIKRLTEF